jgi:hypothetical protein
MGILRINDNLKIALYRHFGNLFIAKININDNRKIVQNGLYLRTSHDSLFIMFEVKNVEELTMAALNQSATYLGDRIGRLGYVVTRNPPGENMLRKQITIFNDSNPRKVLLISSRTPIS